MDETNKGIQENDDISGSITSVVSAVNIREEDIVSKELEKTKQESEETIVAAQEKETSSANVVNLDLGDFTVEEILDAYPLEPCVIQVSLSSEGKEEEQVSQKLVGLPGFIDFETKRFFLLDGSPVMMNNFDEKFKEFLYREIKAKEKNNDKE